MEKSTVKVAEVTRQSENEAAGGKANWASPETVRRISPDLLRPHLVQLEIYGDQPGADLIESVREHGVLEPLLVTEDHVIISGQLRCAASVEAGLAAVPVITVKPADEDAAIDLLLNANSQRVKTNEQIAREASFRMKVERAKAKKRQATAGANGKLPAKSPEAAGDTRAIVARQMGIGGKKVDQYVLVVDTLAELKDAGNEKACEVVRNALKQSVNKAAQKVFVLKERAKHGVQPLLRKGDTAPVIQDKTEIVTSLQDDLADGLERWTVATLLAFAKAQAAFKAEWFGSYGEEEA